MGLQHALDDVERRADDAEDAPDNVVDASPNEAAAMGRRTGPKLAPVVAKAVDLARSLVDVRGSVWKVIAIGIATYVLAFGISYFLVLKPAWAQLDEVVARKALIHDFLLFRESNTAVAEFRNALMQGDQRVTVVGELEAMAREVGLTPIGEAKLPPSKDVSEEIKEYPMELRFSGSYHDVGEYLSQLEAAPRFLMVKEVELVAREGGSSKAEVTIIVSAVSWEE
jgi:Tfp pilus assembly protein PilO